MIALLIACRQPVAEPPADDTDLPPEETVFPHLWASPEDKESMLERREQEPWSIAWASVLDRADDELAVPDPAEDGWDNGAHAHNARIAAANALIAWLDDDADAAATALDALSRITPDAEQSNLWDLNIRMPNVLIPASDAYDFLRGTPFATTEELGAIEAVLTNITGDTFDRYVRNDLVRNIALGPSQNNHPIRTACAIGYPALLFPDHPDAQDWRNWAFSELEYLWGPNGQYVQADGGVSEGPFYFGFAISAAVPTLIAASRVLGDTPLERDCINRQDIEPWAGHGCVDGEEFVFENPLLDGQIASTLDWSMTLRLPWGHRPPLADGYLEHVPVGSALLSHFTGEDRYLWDWVHNRSPYAMGDEAGLYLKYIDAGDGSPPDWETAFLPAAGNALFRSGWDDDGRWLLLVAEEGSARMTLHDHVDGTSFSMAAYGEYLLLDPGYYKPTELDNAITSHAPSHNVVLIDGWTGPDKGLLTDFGDTDAFLENTAEGGDVAWAEARQIYQDTEVVRGIAFVDERYFVVADRLTGGDGTREHRWRLGGYAGYDAGGTYEIRDNGARFERTAAGADVYLAATEDGLAIEEPLFVADEPPHVHVLLWDSAGPSAHHAVMDGVLDGLSPDFLAVLAPYRVGDEGVDGPMEVTAVDAGENAVAWRIGVGDAVDLAWLREEAAASSIEVDGQTVETDAAFALVRLEGAGDVAIAARGSYLRVDGAARLEGTDPVLVPE